MKRRGYFQFLSNKFFSSAAAAAVELDTGQVLDIFDWTSIYFKYGFDLLATTPCSASADETDSLGR